MKEFIKAIFAGFIVVELLTLAPVIIFIVKAQKLVNKNNNQNILKVKH